MLPRYLENTRVRTNATHTKQKKKLFHSYSSTQKNKHGHKRRERTLFNFESSHLEFARGAVSKRRESSTFEPPLPRPSSKFNKPCHFCSTKVDADPPSTSPPPARVLVHHRNITQRQRWRMNGPINRHAISHHTLARIARYAPYFVYTPPRGQLCQCETGKPNIERSRCKETENLF